VILSNTSIQQALDEGWLKIEPEPSPRRKTGVGDECPYDTTAVDLTLGDEVAWFKEGLAINIDLRLGRFADLFGPNSESRVISHEQPFALNTGTLVLGRTCEKVTLPILQDNVPSLAARVEGKSSYARCGLVVHFTAPTIHAGFEGPITLELINLGSIPIMLYPGAPICQLILEQVQGVPFRNDSQFHEQTHPSGLK